MTEQQASSILERALGLTGEGEILLQLRTSEQASVRFANSGITQAVAREEAILTIQVAHGQRVGVAQTNQFDEDTLRQTARHAHELADQSEPDPEYMPPVEPCPVPAVDAWSDATAGLSAADRADVVRRAIEAIASHGLKAAGSFTTETASFNMLNSAGHHAHHCETSARLACTAIGEDSSGWAAAEHEDWRTLDVEALAGRAASKALAARQPWAFEPRPCTVILEPAAVAELLAFLAWSLDAKAADEGRSAFSSKLGTQIAVPRISLRTEPTHPECPTMPFSGDGMPQPSVDWIRDGVLTNLSHSRFWAQKSGRPYTGRPVNMLMPGSDKSLDQIVADTDEGLLVTRFWYIRFVDPMKLLVTGMTRDGLFRVENGQIVHGVRNLRFNESPLRMLERVVEMGVPQRTAGYVPGLIPPLKVEGFTFSSATAF